MKILFLKSYGMDLSDEALTKEIAQSLPNCTDSVLELDFSGCIIDYPATSAIIDSALERLASVGGNKLVVIFNINFKERLFLKWLLFGSSRLNLHVGTATDDELKHKLQAELKRLRLMMNLLVVDPESKISLLDVMYGQ